MVLYILAQIRAGKHVLFECFPVIRYSCNVGTLSVKPRSELFFCYMIVLVVIKVSSWQCDLVNVTTTLIAVVVSYIMFVMMLRLELDGKLATLESMSTKRAHAGQ